MVGNMPKMKVEQHLAGAPAAVRRRMLQADVATAAAILADTEETVRKHYARDSGQAAAANARAAVLAHHKPMFRKLKK